LLEDGQQVLSGGFQRGPGLEALLVPLRMTPVAQKGYGGLYTGHGLVKAAVAAAGIHQVAFRRTGGDEQARLHSLLQARLDRKAVLPDAGIQRGSGEGALPGGQAGGGMEHGIEIPVHAFCSGLRLLDLPAGGLHQRVSGKPLRLEAAQKGFREVGGSIRL
jgi:hypothetical protein